MSRYHAQNQLLKIRPNSRRHIFLKLAENYLPIKDRKFKKRNK